MPEDQLPAIIVESPGTGENEPVARGDGSYDMKWLLDVCVLVSAKGSPGGYPTALRIARDWSLAVRGILIQQRDESGLISAIDFLGERYETIDASGDRTICLGRVAVEVTVPGAIYRWCGPLGPLAPPEETPGPEDPAWTTAQTVDVDLVKVPIEEEL
jgi:hypothetical protein